jgi:hypothetical protein
MNIITKVHDKSTIKKLAEDKFGQCNQQLSNNKQLRFGKKGSIAVELEGDKAGLWIDFSELKGGSLIHDPNRTIDRYPNNAIVIRTDLPNGGKRFMQTHLDPKTQQWINKAPEGGFPLFEKGSNDPKAPVLILEGEKTVKKAVESFPEYLVVTWQGGAGNLKKNISNNNFMKFKNREIILWADNDPVGIKAMEELSEHLIDNGNNVSMVDVSDLPEKWDLGDDDPEGIDLNLKLSSAVKVNPIGFGKSVDEIMAMEFPPIKFIIPELAPVGSMLIAGDSKDGKSILVLSCFIRDYLDNNPDKNVFMFDLEQYIPEYKDRLIRLGMDHYGSRLNAMNQEEYNEGGYRSPEKMMSALERALKYGNNGIILIDTVTKFLVGVPDDYVSVDNFMSRFSFLGKAHDCLIICNYHTNKTIGANKPQHRIMGSVGFQSSVDVAMVVERIDPTASKTILSDLKGHAMGKSLKITDEYLRFNVAEGGFGFEMAPFDVLDNLKPNETVKNNIANLLRKSDRPLQQFEIVERYNDSYLSIDRSPIQKGEVSSALSKLVREGIVKRLEPNTNDNPRDVVVWDC